MGLVHVATLIRPSFFHICTHHDHGHVVHAIAEELREK